MNKRPFYFEIKDVIAQFIAAFDDVVISRFNKNREEEDQIKVRYLYAPKQRVMHDIINENKTITLPTIAVNVNSVTRDTSRVFNKIDGFYYSGTTGDDRISKHIKPPVPVNISVSMSILARYQTDMDQILSNFIPFTNPYVIISWYVPKEFNLVTDQEIRSEVLWDGNVSLSYPIELVATQKARMVADTTFTIKGWLFKDNADPVGNIFYIDQNFHAESIISDYETMSGEDNNILETFELSGSPWITDIFFNGIKLYDDLTLNIGTTGNVMLYGTGFTHAQTILISSNNPTFYTQLTALSATVRQPGISGSILSGYEILNDNIITFPLPLFTGRPLYDPTYVRFIPYNVAGYSFSDQTMFTQTYSAFSTFIVFDYIDTSCRAVTAMDYQTSTCMLISSCLYDRNPFYIIDYEPGTAQSTDALVNPYLHAYGYFNWTDYEPGNVQSTDQTVSGFLHEFGEVWYIGYEPGTVQSTDQTVSSYLFYFDPFPDFEDFEGKTCEDLSGNLFNRDPFIYTNDFEGSINETVSGLYVDVGKFLYTNDFEDSTNETVSGLYTYIEPFLYTNDFEDSTNETISGFYTSISE